MEAGLYGVWLFCYLAIWLFCIEVSECHWISLYYYLFYVKWCSRFYYLLVGISTHYKLFRCYSVSALVWYPFSLPLNGRSDKWGGAWSTISLRTGKHLLHGKYLFTWTFRQMFIHHTMYSHQSHRKWIIWLQSQRLIIVCCQFPLGFSVAGSVRVGSALGAGDTEQAKLSAKLAMFCAGTCACQTPQIIFKSLTTANKAFIL